MCNGNSETARACDDKKARTCILNCLLTTVPGRGVNSLAPSLNTYALSIRTPACREKGDSGETSAILLVEI